MTVLSKVSKIYFAQVRADALISALTAGFGVGGKAMKTPNLINVDGH